MKLRKTNSIPWFRVVLLALLAVALVGEPAVPTWAMPKAGKGRVRGQAHLVSPYDRNARALAATRLLRADSNWKKEKGKLRDFLRQDQYEEIKTGAVAALRHYDPAQHVFIGLGRSPTTLVAFWQNLGLNREEAFNVPASGMRERIPDAAAWQAHLEHFMPKSVWQSGKDVVVVDRTSSGASLLQARQLVETFLRNKGSNAQVKVLAYSSAERHPELATDPLIGPNRIDISASLYPELYQMNRYTHWAEYGHHVVGESDATGLQRRAEYDQYSAKLLERMKRDPTLDAIVLELNGQQ